MFSMCLIVTTCLRPMNWRAGMRSESTIAKPEKTAPATKYGGKIVVCQPGRIDVAKSKETMVWTESTSGVEMPASSMYAHFQLFQCRADPRQPSAKKPYTKRRVRETDASRSVARSGTRPTYQNSSETVKYVPMAKTSHTSGDLKFGHICIVFGIGTSQYAANQGRPVWRPGNIAAQMTAKSVIASAKRLMDVRQPCWKSRRIAEMSVPACPMPTHQTKLMMSNAQ